MAIENYNIIGTNRDNKSIYDQIKKDAASSFEKAPTLYIGLGGTGKDILLRFRENLFLKYENKYKTDNPIEFLYYDLDQSCSQYDQRGIYNDLYFKENIDFKENELLLITPDLTRIFSRINEPEYQYIKKWASEGLHALDVKSGAGQQRQISRLSFFSEFDEIRKKLEEKLRSLQKKLTGSTNRINVELIFSIAGGTGCGSFFDMAFLCKYLGIKLNLNLFISAHVVLSSAFRELSQLQEHFRANTYAALKEIETYMPGGKHYLAKWRPDMTEEKIPTPIFNECYIITGERYQEPPFATTSDVFDCVAEYLTNNITNKGFNEIKNSTKVNCANYLNTFISSDIVRSSDKKSFIDLSWFTCKYSSYGVAKIGIPSDRINKCCSARLALDVISTLEKNYYEANQYDKNKVESEAKSFMSEFFLQLDEASPRFNEMIKMPDNSGNIYDAITENIKTIVSEYIGINPSKSINIKLNTDIDAIISKLKNELIDGKLNYSTNSSDIGEYAQKVNNNFNSIKHNNLESKKIEELIFKPGMLIADVSRDYGIDKTKYFITCLENETTALKNKIQKYKSENIFKADELKSWLKIEIEKISEAYKKEKNKNERLYKKKQKFDDYLKEIDEGFGFPFSLLKDSARRNVKSLIAETDKTIKKDEEPFANKLNEYYRIIVEKLADICKKHFNVEVLCEFIDSYYKNVIDKMFLKSPDTSYTNLFFPFCSIAAYENNLNRISAQFKKRFDFYNKFKISQNQILIKDGDEISKDKKFEEIISEYYSKAANEFVELPDKIDFTRKEKNKFDDYLKNWKKEFYAINSLEEKPEIKDFINKIIEINERGELEKLFESLKIVSDTIISQKLEYNIFKTREGQEHILNRKVNLLKKMSEVSFKPSVEYMGHQENRIVKDDVNYFHFVFVNEQVDGRHLDQHLDLKQFNDKTVGKRNGTSEKDNVLFFCELHGFPLFYMHTTQAELKPAYLKPPRDEYSHPLHLAKNKTMFNDLIPIFDTQNAENYKEKLKIYFYALLFDIIKYNEINNNYKFVYLRARNDEQTEIINGGSLLLDEMEKKIYTLDGETAIRDYLKFQYMRDNNFGIWDIEKNKFKILNDNGKLKLYYCLRYQENLIKQELFERKSYIINENKQINPDSISSIFLYIIMDEIKAFRQNYASIIDSDQERFDNFNENADNNSNWENTRNRFNGKILQELDYETGETLRKKVKIILSEDDFSL